MLVKRNREQLLLRKRSKSVTENNIPSIFDVPLDGRNLIGDFSGPHTLPIMPGKHSDLAYISCRSITKTFNFNKFSSHSCKSIESSDKEEHFDYRRTIPVRVRRWPHCFGAQFFHSKRNRRFLLSKRVHWKATGMVSKYYTVQFSPVKVLKFLKANNFGVPLRI